MFDIDRFAAVCRAALVERGSDAIREVVRRAVSEPGDIIAALGEQTGAFAGILVRASDLTILNVVWGARQWTLPHNHCSPTPGMNFRSCKNSGSQRTHCWRKTDSNFWSHLKEESRSRARPFVFRARLRWF